MYGTVCDECEKNPPIVQCEACLNSLCAKCYARHQRMDVKALVQRLAIA